MADVAISYAHADAQITARVRAAIEAHRLSVWIDESGEDTSAAESINLPPGQKHWDVITSEFVGADVVLVIDTVNWRQSEYCQDEYRFLRDWGKWVVHVAPEDPHTYSAFVATLREQRATIRAHTRLVQAARASASAPIQSRAERILNRSHAHDARRVLEPNERQEVSVSDELAKFAGEALDRDRAVRRKLIRAGMIGTAVLAVLALIGVLTWTFAEAKKRSAEHNADRSIALNLASESRNEENSFRAVDLATQAHARQPSRETSEALAQATARDSRMRVVPIDKQPYKGAVWAPGGRTLVAYTNSEIYWLDGETGRVQARRDAVDDIVNGAVVASADGRTVAFVASDALWVITSNLDDKLEFVSPNVVAVATGNGTDLWWAWSLHGAGGIMRGTFETSEPHGSEVFKGTPALSFTVDSDRGLVDYVGTDGKVHSLRGDQDGLAEYASFDVVTLDVPEGRYGATITRCGDNLFGIFYGGAGIHFTLGYGAKTFSSVQGKIEVVEKRSNGKTPPVCQPDGSAVQSNYLGSQRPDTVRAVDPRPDIPEGAEVYVLAADPGGTRLAVLTWQGQLYLPGHDHISSWPVENAVTLLPLSRDLAILGDGAVVDAATRDVVGKISSQQVYSSTLSIIGDTAYVLTGEGVIAIRADGSAEKVFPADPTTITDMRAGADGKHLVLALKKSVVLLDLATRSTSRTPIQGLTDDDLVLDADITTAGDTVVVVTANGRVASINIKQPNTPKFHDRTLAPGDQLRIAVSPGSGQILVAGQDGVLRILDQNLHQVAEAFAGKPTERMTLAGAYALLAFDNSAMLYDVSKQETIDVIDSPLDPETTRIDIQRKVLRGLRFNAFAVSEIGNPATMRRIEIPLPGVK
ncbi:toll/interleukin-1 receptor domain-containing protein [Nocardia sp. NPDC049737]|uniref:toll/interleukin-1 receptor domain-containing protein n=1 Tax=Nocardia sp. NPDC049737 TaxID=3154358 RepID=UPI00343F0EA7